MLSKPTFVELITHEHRFTSKIYTHGKRLGDILNDQTTDFLRVHDADIYRYNAPRERVAGIKQAIIRKSDLHLVIITRDEHEAPTQRFFGFVQKVAYHTFLTIPGYEVYGKIHLPHQHDINPIAILTHELSTFFPVTSVKASQAGTNDEVFAYPVALVNRRSLTLFYIGEEPLESALEKTIGAVAI